MCGRFALASSAQAIAEYLETDIPEVFVSRYNIAPTTPVLAKTATGLTFFRWGLVPAWAKELSIGNRMFNARAETVSEKPSFRHAFKRRRCLIPATGFYEWHTENSFKRPYFCHINQSLFCFAGIWEQWQDGAGNELQSCAILTTAAVGSMEKIHHRMPVVISRENHNSWLNHQSESTSQAMDCLAELMDQFDYYPVSSKVNSTGNDSAELIQAVQR